MALIRIKCVQNQKSFHWISRKRDGPLKLGIMRGVRSFMHSSLLMNILYYDKEAKMFIFQIYPYMMNKFLICYAIRGFVGLEVQYFVNLYLINGKYFAKHYKKENAQNDVLNNI